MIPLYGWRPDLDSSQDLFSIPWFDHLRLNQQTPDVTDNGQYVAGVYTQTNNDCTANSGVKANRYYRAANGLPDLDGSRRFLYAATRIAESGLAGLASDEGATIADTVAEEAKDGICLESTWPYDKDVFLRPSPEAYAEALQHTVLRKLPVRQTQQSMEAVLAAKQPIQFGLRVYESFEDATDGVVPMPLRGDQFMGGHALYLFGYDRPRRLVFGQNSWGPCWGMGGLGLFCLPYDMILDPDLASDWWTISAVRN